MTTYNKINRHNFKVVRNTTKMWFVISNVIKFHSLSQFNLFFRTYWKLSSWFECQLFCDWQLFRIFHCILVQFCNKCQYYVLLSSVSTLLNYYNSQNFLNKFFYDYFAISTGFDIFYSGVSKLWSVIEKI